MKKVLVAGLAVLMLFMVACGNSAAEDAVTLPGDGENQEQEDALIIVDPDDYEDGEYVDISGGMVLGAVGGATTIADFVDGLAKDVYPELEMTVAVLERMAILPGAVFRVNIVITNNGDRTIAYTQGSGGNVIPDALFVTSEGLQAIPPQDRLGMATMDFNVLQLAPGESLNFDWFVLAAAPSTDFSEAAQNLYMTDNLYVGDLTWDELYDKIPGLVTVEPGTYEIEVAFRFHLVDDAEGLLFAADDAFIATAIPVAIQ